MTDGYVSFRELGPLLDNREARITAQVFDVDRRLERLDDQVSRGIQRLGDQLAEEFRRHGQEHRQAVSGRQWALTTFLAGASLLVAVLQALIGH